MKVFLTEYKRFEFTEAVLVVDLRLNGSIQCLTRV